MQNSFYVNVTFHSAGQGLFASGVLRTESSHKTAIFDWVYDCGSTSGKAHLKNSIQRHVATRKRNRGDSPIDLVVLSHFDIDHINGLIELLGATRIHTLLLPLIPIEQRISIALAERAIEDSDFMRFLIDPVEFISTLDDGSVRRLLFVPPSGEVGPPSVQGDETPPERRDDSQDEPYDFNEDSDPEGLFSSSHEPGGSIEVRFLADGGKLRVRDFWEFVPYNDTLLEPVDLAFRTKVELLAGQLRTGATKAERTEALAKLKEIFETKFPGKKMRNRISLFLYGGAVSSADVSKVITLDSRFGWHNRYCNCYGHGGAILYTGDGYLNDDASFKRLAVYLKMERIEAVCVFQVMHHGAEPNWHDGIARKINACFNVFSSDPDHAYHHPDSVVLRDFWTRNPIQVDRYKAAEFELSFRWS